MKWKKLSARNFGPLSHWEAEIDTPVTVFLGHNEAGKTTLMELMCALLFGQRRRKDEVNALIAWGHSQANLEGEILRDSGAEAHVTRTYQNGAVSGTLTQAGEILDIGGEPLSWVKPVNRELYRDVFALSLNDLIFPGQDAWSESQDRMLTGQFGQELRPAQEVSQELYKEAMGLWRPDRRGKTQMEALDEEIAATAAALETAKAREQRRLDLCEEAVRLEEQLQALQSQEAAFKARESQLAALAEPMERMRRALDMEQRAAGAAALELPENPEAVLSRAQEEERRLAARIGETGRKLAETHARLERVGEKERILMEHAGQVEALKRAMEAEAPQTAEAAREARRARDAYLEAELLEGDSLLAGYLPEDLDKLANRAAQSQSRLAQSQLAYQEKRDSFSTSTTPALTVLGILALAIGVLLCPLVPLLSKFAAWPLCMAWAGIGLILLILVLPVRASRRRRYLKDAKIELENARLAAESEGLALREAWSGLSLSGDNDSLEKLIARSMDAAQLDHALRQADAQWSAVLAAEDALTADCRVLCAALQEEAGDDPRQKVLQLAARLEDIRLWQREEPLLQEQLQQLRVTLDEDKARLQAAQDQERDLLALLSPMPGATQAEKLQQLRERTQWARQAQALRASLQGQELPDPELYRRDVLENNRLLEENAARQRQISHDLGISQQGIRELSQNEALSLQEKLDTQMRQQSEMAYRRDRLAAMSCLVDMARNRYQQENQNEIIGKASGYLSRITDGRYSRLMMTDDRKGVRIYSVEAGGFLDPAKDRLSKGTQEQIYLSLRLGLIDHLDPQGEALPLILDETFVNWDRDRLERGIGLFKELTRNRQVFAFTCHDWMAQAMAQSGCETKIVRL